MMNVSFLGATRPPRFAAQALQSQSVGTALPEGDAGTKKVPDWLGETVTGIQRLELLDGVMSKRPEAISWQTLLEAFQPLGVAERRGGVAADSALGRIDPAFGLDYVTDALAAKDNPSALRDKVQGWLRYLQHQGVLTFQSPPPEGFSSVFARYRLTPAGEALLQAAQKST